MQTHSGNSAGNLQFCHIKMSMSEHAATLDIIPYTTYVQLNRFFTSSFVEVWNPNLSNAFVRITERSDNPSSKSQLKSCWNLCSVQGLLMSDLKKIPHKMAPLILRFMLQSKDIVIMPSKLWMSHYSRELTPPLGLFDIIVANKIVVREI